MYNVSFSGLTIDSNTQHLIKAYIEDGNDYKKVFTESIAKIEKESGQDELVLSSKYKPPVWSEEYSTTSDGYELILKKDDKIIGKGLLFDRINANGAKRVLDKITQALISSKE